MSQINELQNTLSFGQTEMQAKNDDFKVKFQKLISENEYLLKINKELVDDNNNLTEALKKTYTEISQVII